MDFRTFILSLTALAFLTVGCAYDDNYRYDQYNRHGHHNRYGNYYKHSHRSNYNYRSRHYQPDRSMEGIDPRDWGRKTVLTPSMDEIWDTYEPRPMRKRKKRHSHESGDRYVENETCDRCAYRKSKSTSTRSEEETAKYLGFKSVKAWRKYKKRRAAGLNGFK